MPLHRSKHLVTRAPGSLLCLVELGRGERLLIGSLGVHLLWPIPFKKGTQPFFHHCTNHPFIWTTSKPINQCAAESLRPMSPESIRTCGICHTRRPKTWTKSSCKNALRLLQSAEHLPKNALNPGNPQLPKRGRNPFLPTIGALDCDRASRSKNCLCRCTSPRYPTR
jgi:hypothetical protein